MRFPTRFALAATLCAAPSCRDNGIDDSADVSTRDIQIVVEVNAGAARTVVRAYPSALLPYSGALTLTGGDELVLHDGDRLEREPGASWYRATTARNSGRFSVDLRRPADTSLLDVGLDAPPPFTLSTPSARVKWSDRIELAWDRAAGDDAMSVVVESDCSKRLVRALQSDTGAYTLNGGEIARLDPTTPCTVTVTVLREAKAVSSRGMYARAAQLRAVEVTLEP